jgi:hypothetical protein
MQGNPGSVRRGKRALAGLRACGKTFSLIGVHHYLGGRGERILLLYGCQAMLDGKFDQAGNIADAQFVHQPAAIGIDGFGR